MSLGLSKLIGQRNWFTHHHLTKTLRWRQNGRDSVSNHQPHDCLLNRVFRRRSKKTSKLRVTGLCAGNSPGTGEFPAQMASYAENVSFDDVIMMPNQLGTAKMSNQFGTLSVMPPPSWSSFTNIGAVTPYGALDLGSVLVQVMLLPFW